LQVNDEDGNLISGSELAALYMLKKIEEMDDMSVFAADVVTIENDDAVEFELVEYDLLAIAERVFEFCRVAGDLDVWREPFGFGGKLALALELMDDLYGAKDQFMSLITTAVTKDISFEESLEEQEILNYYFNMANNKLAGALSMAERSCIQLGPKLHKIEAKFFPDHCAEHIYNKTNGVVLVTYPNSRKISFRCHSSIDVHLGNFAASLGGGGHARSAGMELSESVTIEDVIEQMLAKLV
jgi:hypothetical protein